MVYAIRTTWYDTDTKEITDLIKIGFTKDGNERTRFTNYKIHNPLYKLLYMVPGATQEDEADLHYYFKDLNVVGEWFRYDQKIIDFFETAGTRETLNKALDGKRGSGTVTQEVVTNIYSYVKKVINRWLCLISTKNTIFNYFNNLSTYIEDCMNQVRHLIYQESDVIPYLSKTYNIPEDIQKSITDFMDGNLKNSKKVSDFLNSFYAICGFKDRMKFLCNYGLSEAELCVVLDQIPLQFKNYYNLLGPERLKANGYNITRVSREILDNGIDKDKLVSSILSVFKVGQRYSKSYIKSTLASIYSEYNYNRSPKATDLEEYFEMKRVMIPNKETGRSDNGFELLKLKV